jgi:hypothetical protein
MKPAGHQLVIPDIEDVWEIKPTYNIHMENLKERYHLGYSGRDVRIILKLILIKPCAKL